MHARTTFWWDVLPEPGRSVGMLCHTFRHLDFVAQLDYWLHDCDFELHLHWSARGQSTGLHDVEWFASFPSDHQSHYLEMPILCDRWIHLDYFLYRRCPSLGNIRRKYWGNQIVRIFFDALGYWSLLSAALYPSLPWTMTRQIRRCWLATLSSAWGMESLLSLHSLLCCHGKRYVVVELLQDIGYYMSLSYLPCCLAHEMSANCSGICMTSKLGS